MATFRHGKWRSIAYSNAAMIIRCARGSNAPCRKDWLASSSTWDEAESQLFPPQHTAASAAVEVQEVLHHSRVLYGHDRHSWTLQTLQQTIAWMRSLTVSAVCQLLRRLKGVYKPGRAHVHWPDLEYDQKLAAIASRREEARSKPGAVVVL